jgi:hypothetical protein
VAHEVGRRDHLELARPRVSATLANPRYHAAAERLSNPGSLSASAGDPAVREIPPENPPRRGQSEDLPKA